MNNTSEPIIPDIGDIRKNSEEQKRENTRKVITHLANDIELASCAGNMYTMSSWESLLVHYGNFLIPEIKSAFEKALYTVECDGETITISW